MLFRVCSVFFNVPPAGPDPSRPLAFTRAHSSIHRTLLPSPPDPTAPRAGRICTRMRTRRVRRIRRKTMIMEFPKLVSDPTGFQSLFRSHAILVALGASTVGHAVLLMLFVQILLVTTCSSHVSSTPLSHIAPVCTLCSVRVLRRFPPPSPLHVFPVRPLRLLAAFA